MKKSNFLLIIGICTGVITLAMLGLGIFTAVFLPNILIDRAAEQFAMKNSTYDQWGQVPGSIGINVTRKYTFFNFTNPFEVFWFNQTPVFTEMPGHLYQEFQNFTNLTYNDADPDKGTIVDYGYQLIIDELSPSPQSVTTLNVGPLGYWQTAKNLPPFQIAFYGLAGLVLDLDTNIITALQALLILDQCLISFENVNATILAPSGVTDPAIQDFMWTDPVYGMGNPFTLNLWVLAITNGPDSDAAYMLGDYFYLTYAQLRTLFDPARTLATCVTGINTMIQNGYNCNTSPCAGNYLLLEQWTSQAITKNPVGNVFPPSNSVGVFNVSIDGYVEISNFLTNYFLVNEPVNKTEYQGIVFSSDLAASLLNVTPSAGNNFAVNTENNTLVNIANLAFIYSYGEAFDATSQIDDLTLLAPIVNQFNLPSLQHAHVIWKYVQYFEQEFLVRQSKNGTTADFVAGQLFSSTLSMLYNFAQEGTAGVLGVPSDLTSQIIYKFIKGNNTDCQTLFTNSASTVINATQIQKICNSSILKGWNQVSIANLYAGCQRPNTINNALRNVGMTVQQIYVFCSTPNAGTFFAHATDAEKYMHDTYGCAANFTTVSKCSNRELAVMQWTGSAITQNPPALLTQYTKSYTLRDWYPSIVLYPFEYLFVISQLGPIFNNNASLMQPLPYDMANQLLTYDALFNQVMVQRSFIAFYTQDWTWFNDVLFGVPAYNLISYVRFTTIESAFGGFAQTRNAHDLLWGYTDLFLLIPYLQPVYDFGDPSINYQIALAGQNCTGKNDILFNSSMYTGIGDSSLTRQFYSINGIDTITYKNTFFDGAKVASEFDTPWAEDIPLQGTDGRFNSPGLDKYDEPLVYINDINYIGKLAYDAIQDYSGLDTYRFMLPKSALLNKTNNPDNAKWFSDRWDGLLNLTTLQKAPFFISKGHMLEVDPILQQAITVYTDSSKQSIATPTSADDTYLDIEPYSGAAVGAMVRLQLNLEIKPDSLFPNPNYYMMPIMLTERGMNFTSSQIDSTFGDLMAGIKFKSTGPPIFFSLFAVFLIITIFVFMKRRALIKRGIVRDVPQYANLMEEGHSRYLQNPSDQSGDNSRSYSPGGPVQSGHIITSREVYEGYAQQPYDYARLPYDYAKQPYQQS